MTTLILVRHGRTTANTDGVLAGWTPGVFLDDLGQQQALGVGERLSVLPLTAVISSPLDRTQQTADAICARQPATIARHTDDRIGECRYGDWTGQKIGVLAKDPMWQVVQVHPSAAVFPGATGESMATMQHRAVGAVREWNTALGENSIYAVVSHGDVIKAILADALGMHLDQFQRIQIDPCSISVIRYTATRPFVLRTNDSGADLSGLRPQVTKTGKKKRTSAARRSSDAVIGGGAG
ncbi:MAG: MSMEG_4193 family putative phosphomutase [Actinomycetota bacterium]|nr:MSMEG_4193 family putative phosphomutase [Actinomycetota bacterium]